MRKCDSDGTTCATSGTYSAVVMSDHVLSEPIGLPALLVAIDDIALDIVHVPQEGAQVRVPLQVAVL